MAIQVWRDADIYMGQYDISGYLNAVALDYSSDILDGTTFGNTTRVRVAGLKNVTCEINGFWDAAATTGVPDSLFYNRISLEDYVLTICPVTGADGEVAYFYKPLWGTYAPGGMVTELLSFRVTADISRGSDTYNRLVRGKIMAPKLARTTSSNGSDVQLGAVGATQRVYAALHVFAASGTSPTLNVIVRSDDASGMADPTTRITFTQAVTTTYEIKSTAGAITDDWWDVSWTIGGSDTPTFNFAVVVGIA